MQCQSNFAECFVQVVLGTGKNPEPAALVDRAVINLEQMTICVQVDAIE